MSSLYLSDILVQFIRNVRRRWTLSVTDTFHGMVFTQKVTDRNNIFSILLEANKVPHVSFLSLSLSGSIVALSIYIIKDVGCLTHQDLNKKTNQQKVYYIRFKFFRQRWISHIIPFMLVASNNAN